MVEETEVVAEATRRGAEGEVAGDAEEVEVEVVEAEVGSWCIGGKGKRKRGLYEGCLIPAACWFYVPVVGQWRWRGCLWWWLLCNGQ